MSEALDKLKSIGAIKINEATHIPVEHVQAMLQENFAKFSKVQFIGFISILEREYEMDLSEFRHLGLEYFKEQDVKEISNGIFDTPKTKDKKPLYILSGVVVLFVIIYALGQIISSDTVSKEESTPVLSQDFTEDSKEIEIDKELPQEENATQDLNLTASVEENVTTTEAEVLPIAAEKEGTDSFKIVAKTKVWFGYINVNTHKKYQKTFKGELSLDAKEEWLLIFGHGFIDMYIDGELQKFKSHKNVHFHYKDGHLETITSREFKRINRGRKW